MKEWKDIPGYKGQYEVSSNGEIRSIGRVVDTQKGARKLKPKNISTSISKGGYLLVHINHSTKYVHRLVGLAFIPNPNHYGDINHINGNKQDNRVENLEWCTRKHNIRHAFDTGLSFISEEQRKNAMRPVIVTTPNGKEIYCESVKEASEVIGYGHYNTLCIRLKKSNICKNGYLARYENPLIGQYNKPI